MQLQTYTMHGKTTRVFPFRPNWANPVNETLEWKTDILRARDGSEQRRALRQIPRRGFDYSLLVMHEMASLFEALVWNWQHRLYAIPVWTDIGKLTSAAAEDDEEIAVNTTSLGFRADDFALLWHSPTSYEVVEVDTVAADSLTLTAGLAGAWPLGTRVYPLVIGHMGGSLQLSRHTGTIAAATVAFQTSPDNTYSHIPSSEPVTLYDGLEVITAKTNWKDAINNDFTRAFDTVDAMVGPIAYFDTEHTSRIARPFQWFLRTRADLIAFRNLMGRLRGQAKSVWIPSWHRDFTVVDSNVTDQSILTIKGSWFHQLVGTDTSRDRLSIKLPNGTTIYRRITLTTPNYSLDKTHLQLSSSVGMVLGPNDGTKVQLLLRCRLATDKVVIPWATDHLATPQTVFTTIKL